MFNGIITSCKLLPSICEKNNNKKKGVSKQLHWTACLDAAASALALAGCYCVTLDSSRSTAGEALLYCSDISRTEVAGRALTARVKTLDQKRKWQQSPFTSSLRLGKEKPPSVSGKTSKGIAGTAFCARRTQSRVCGEQRERNAWRYSLARHCRENHKVQSVLLVHIHGPWGAQQPPSCPTSGRGPLLIELGHNGYKLLRITHFFTKYTQVLVSCGWN